MKKLFVILLAPLMASNALGAAICRLGDEVVVVNNSRSITVSGLEEKGILNGTYNCVVTYMGPGFFSVQTAIQCQKVNQPSEVVQGWMIEGLGGMVQHTASVALYNKLGLKIFEAGCGRQ